MSRSKPTPSDKLLISLPFWEGDKKQAMKLARLLADLEDTHSSKADLLLVARFDCKHDTETIKHVSRKFNVYEYTSKDRRVGWPQACNGIFFSALEWAYFKMEAGQIPHYRGLLNIAPDGGPLQKDWLAYFHGASEEKEIYVSGALLKDPDTIRNHDHINGDCCLLSTKLSFLKWFVKTSRSSSFHGGWDWFLANPFRNWGWKNLSGVKSVWRKPEPFSEKDWDREACDGVVWYHGVKDDSLINLGRKKLLL